MQKKKVKEAKRRKGWREVERDGEGGHGWMDGVSTSAARWGS